MTEICVVQRADITSVGKTKNAHESLARKSGASRRENNKKYRKQIRFIWFRIIINSGFL
jgi:hypothetical protein